MSADHGVNFDSYGIIQLGPVSLGHPGYAQGDDGDVVLGDQRLWHITGNARQDLG
jgi:hypothetical protein